MAWPWSRISRLAGAITGTRTVDGRGRWSGSALTGAVAEAWPPLLRVLRPRRRGPHPGGPHRETWPSPAMAWPWSRISRLAGAITGTRTVPGRGQWSGSALTGAVAEAWPPLLPAGRRARGAIALVVTSVPILGH